MRLYKKDGKTIQVLSFPSDNVEKGEYLIIEDPRVNKKLIIQVIDVQFANVPGLLEELLRDSTTDKFVREEIFDPLEVSSHMNYIQDSWMLLCKIRGTIENEKLGPDVSWLPSRCKSGIRKFPISSLLTHLKDNSNLPINIGETKEESQFTINAHGLDGKLNIVTGKKGTGKSHLAKLLVLGLIDHGATVVVLDLNGEYTNLGFSSNGKKNAYHERIKILTPGANLRVSLAQTNLKVVLNILVHALDLPGTSTQEFRRIWHSLQQRSAFTLRELGEAIGSWKCNQRVRDALFSRYCSLLNSGFFTDNNSEATTLEEFIEKTRMGGALILNLRDVSLVDRQIIVEYALGKLVDLLGQWKIRAVFLVAEEAHLYLRETYWNDIVTRMRHFGVFTTFVTNQPDTIRENIYRQADNIFLFNFTNERDLETVSKAARVDSETVKSIAQDLPPHHCLVLGRAVKDFPIATKVRGLDVRAMGQTRLFFKEEN